ncbi:MAG: hypothetical protein AB1705_23895 [Verrucomicrobiota bacterium]
MERLAIIALVLIAAWAARGAYLPFHGPATLRFRVHSSEGPSALPPLLEPVATNLLVTVTNTVFVTNVVTVTVTNLAPAASAVATNLAAASPSPAPTIHPAPEAAPLPPQLLLPFFRNNTNAPTIVAPVGFTPPPLTPPASSSATFEKR